MVSLEITIPTLVIPSFDVLVVPAEIRFHLNRRRFRSGAFGVPCPSMSSIAVLSVVGFQLCNVDNMNTARPDRGRSTAISRCSRRVATSVPPGVPGPGEPEEALGPKEGTEFKQNSIKSMIYR